MNAYKKITSMLFIFGIFFFCSCEKFLDPGTPPDKVFSEDVYANDISAATELTGIFYDMQLENGIAQGVGSLSLQCGLQSDEIAALPDTRFSGQYRNNNRHDFWTKFYELIYRTNVALEGLSKATALSTRAKDHLSGEAYFLRAFFYFHLVNLYGDVPLVLGTDYKANSVVTRTPAGDVSNQVIKDLESAINLLSEDYLAASISAPAIDRIRPNKSVAKALLSRVYLYRENWIEAAALASQLIENTAVYDTTTLDKVFLKNSKEAIWQLQPGKDGEEKISNTLDAVLFVLQNSTNVQKPLVVAADFLLAAFEHNDRRRLEWIGINKAIDGTTYYYPAKYKLYPGDADKAQYLMVFRLAEQYLIRAEARLYLGDLNGAIKDLNTLRHRAGLPDTDAMNQTQLSAAIMHERQVELFTEWGHRWFDLKRTGKIDEVMSKICPLKDGIWEPYKQLFDIPVPELKLNRNVKQNPGYPFE